MGSEKHFFGPYEYKVTIRTIAGHEKMKNNSAILKIFKPGETFIAVKKIDDWLLTDNSEYIWNPHDRLARRINLEN